MARRKRSKIDRLDPEFKSTVEEMIISNHFSYAEIAEFIHDNTGQTISRQAVCNHAKGLCESLEALHIAQENFKMIMRELNNYPDLNSTEGIVQLMAYKLFMSVEQVSQDELKKADPLKLMKQALYCGSTSADASRRRSSLEAARQKSKPPSTHLSTTTVTFLPRLWRFTE